MFYGKVRDRLEALYNGLSYITVIIHYFSSNWRGEVELVVDFISFVDSIIGNGISGNRNPYSDDCPMSMAPNVKEYRYQNAEMKKRPTCPKCNIKLLSLELKETFDYYVGDHKIEVVAWIPHFECDICRFRRETIGARELRNEALKSAIDRFWKQVLQGSISDGTFGIARNIFKDSIKRFGGRQKGKIAEEFGRWLLECYYE